MKFSPTIVRFFFFVLWFCLALAMGYRLFVLGCLLFLDPSSSSYFSSFLLCAFGGWALDYSFPPGDLPSSTESPSSSSADGEILTEDQPASEELPQKEEPVKPKVVAPYTVYDYMWIFLGLSLMTAGALTLIILLYYRYTNPGDDPALVKEVLLSIEELLQSIQIHGGHEGGYEAFLKAHADHPSAQVWPQIEAMRLHVPGARPVPLVELKQFESFLWGHAPPEYFEELSHNLVEDLGLDEDD